VLLVLPHMPRRLRGVRVGNFEYTRHALQLGALLGNRFQILIRHCVPLAGDGGDGGPTDLDALEQQVNTVGA
jgi:hypothetical protein